MQSITGYRTKLMAQDRAERFARCLSGNPRFVNVAVTESSRARGAAKWFVAYQPASEERQAELRQDAQDTRAERAQAQAENYLFVLDDTGRYFHCLNVTSGEVYETTEHSCSCPDATYGCRPAGIHCKHTTLLRSDRAHIRGWG